MRIITPRFGELEIPEETIVLFPEGLPGFKSRHWVVFVREETPMIEWLQSVDEPEIALMTMDPIGDLLLNYRPEPKPGELSPICANNVDETTIRTIIRNADTPGRLSINLFAPLFYNVPERLGMQLPLMGSGLRVNELWPPEELIARQPLDTPQAGKSATQTIDHHQRRPHRRRA